MKSRLVRRPIPRWLAAARRYLPAGIVALLLVPAGLCQPEQGLIKEAIEGYRAGRLDVAVEKLEQARAQAPGNANVHLYLGLMLYERNADDPRALELLESAAGHFPSNPELHLRLLDSCLRLKNEKRIPDLIERCRKMMEADTRFAFAVVYTLVRYELLDLAGAELEKLADGLQRQPAHTPPGEVSFIRGLIAVSANRKDEALRLFQEADRSRFPPEKSLQMRMLAEALGRIEEFRLSAQAWQVYVTHNPQDTDARMRMAVSYMSVPSLDRARAALQEVLARSPSTPMAHYYLGLVLVELKNNDEARRNFELELKNDPGSFKAMSQLALLAYNHGDDDGCRQWLQKASSLDPEWVDTQYVYGLLCNREGKYDEAVRSLESAARQAPKNIKIRLQLSTAYLRAGNDAKAREHRAVYERLLEEHKLKSLLDDARRK
jgi:tetratricopeptide (TPR) repeat protein